MTNNYLGNPILCSTVSLFQSIMLIYFTVLRIQEKITEPCITGQSDLYLFSGQIVSPIDSQSLDLDNRLTKTSMYLDGT